MSPKMQYIIQNRIMTMYAVDKLYSQNTYFAMLKVKKYGLHGGRGDSQVKCQSLSPTS